MLTQTAGQESIIPEFREMITTGRKYLLGEAHFMEVRGCAVTCEKAAQLFSAADEIREMAASWNRIIETHWNEWGLVAEEDLVSANDLREFIRKDLDIFEPHDHLPTGTSRG